VKTVVSRCDPGFPGFLDPCVSTRKRAFCFGVFSTNAIRPEPVEGLPRSGWHAVMSVKIKGKTAGGSPTASHFFLRRQEKVTKKKATPVCRRCAVPCVARLVRRLRNSRYALRQSSPKSPDQPPLLGGAQGKKSKNRKSGGQQVAHHTEVDWQNNSTSVH